MPVLNFVNRKENSGTTPVEERESKEEDNVQWALGKAGEDRVHVVVSEEEGWLFVGIYDGFNGPDAPEFLMGNLYRAVYNELKGLFWEVENTTNAVADSDNTTNPLVEKIGKSDGESSICELQIEEIVVPKPNLSEELDVKIESTDERTKKGYISIRGDRDYTEKAAVGISCRG